ncbi:MAG: hypothetical protein WC889_06985, partial [Myxococcota bacterium]
MKKAIFTAFLAASVLVAVPAIGQVVTGSGVAGKTTPEAPVAVGKPAEQPAAQSASSSAKTLDEEYTEYQKLINVLKEKTEEYQKEIQLIVERKKVERQTALKSSYERIIKELEVDQRKRRNDAIARFEEFLRKYPND